MVKRVFGLVLSCLGILILVSIGWQAKPILAQEPEPPEYTGLDVIFLVDQSGSMGGLEAGSQEHPDPNDPHGWRFYALQAAVQRLGPLLLMTHPNSTARIAAIEFGDQAQVALPITEIEASSLEDWAPQEEDLLEQIEEYKDERENQNLGNTNHQRAFLLARDLFNEMEAKDDSPRLKVIIILTDGRPCVGTVDPETGQGGCQPWAPHLMELRDELIPDNFPADEGYYVFVVAINDSNDHYWSDTRDYWEVIAESQDGRAEKVSSQEEVGVFFNEVLAELVYELPHTGAEPIPPVPEEVSGFYPVVPYLQSITFSIYKSEPGEWISLEEVGNPLDVTQSSSDGRISVTGYEPSDMMFGQIEVSHPEPGQWRIEEPPGSNVIVTVQGILFDPQLISPVGELSYGVPARIELNLVDINGALVPQYDNPLYALEVAATIGTEQGDETIELDQEQPGEYIGLFTPTTMGSHTVHLRATSHYPSGDEFTVMDQEAGTFTVGPLIAELETPTEGVYQNIPFILTYNLLDSRGNLIGEIEGAEDIFSIEATVTGEGESTTLTLTQERGGVYAAEYTPTEPGPHQAHLTITSEDVSGQEITVLDEDSGTFEVEPTTGLEYDLIRPQDGTRSLIRPWWLFPIRPMVVEVEVTDENGTPVVLSQVISGAPEEAFDLQVKDPTGEDQSAELDWTVTDVGRMQAVGKGFNELGQWTVEVAPDFEPHSGYALLDRDPTSVTVTRAEHYLAFVTDGLLLLIILTVAAIWVIRRRAVTRPPLLTGTLHIRDGAGNIVWSRPLSVGRNRVTFSGRDLPVVTRLKNLKVVRAPGKEATIEVRGKLDNNSPIAASRMVYKSRRRLGSYNLYLHYEQY